MQDSDRHLLIGEMEGRPIGVVRFDLDKNEATISIYLDPTIVGNGVGAHLLSAAELWLIKKCPHVTMIVAKVLADNEASHRLFRGLDYSRRSTTYHKGLK
jgi:RimJ/RimL family protein N-acetyltransferase